MSTMQQLFSEYFDNGASDESFEKEAQVELFAKLASENGIDLNQLSENQIAHLWNETFSKQASEEEDDEDDAVSKAKEEHEKKKEAAAKIAEAEYLGQVMAHSMTEELRKLSGVKEMLGKARGAVSDFGDKYMSALKGTEVAKAKKLRDRAATRLGDAARRTGQTGDVQRDVRGAVVNKLNKRVTKERAKQVGAYAAPAVLGGGALYGAHRMGKSDSEKRSSALDDLAAEEAIVKAASAGWDLDEASDRVSAVMTLGVDESEKIAYAQDLETAVDVRSLELLEAAGYPVNWN